MEGCLGMCSIYLSTLIELITNSIIISKECCSVVLIFDQWFSVLDSNLCPAISVIQVKCLLPCC